MEDLGFYYPDYRCQNYIGHNYLYLARNYIGHNYVLMEDLGFYYPDYRCRCFYLFFFGTDLGRSVLVASHRALPTQNRTVALYIGHRALPTQNRTVALRPTGRARLAHGPHFGGT